MTRTILYLVNVNLAVVLCVGSSILMSQKQRDYSAITEALTQNNLRLESKISELQGEVASLSESISFEQKKNTKVKKIKGIITDTIKKEKYASYMNQAEMNIFATAIADYSERYDVPASLILAVARKESHFNPKAVSEMYAQGLMQLLPETADECAKDLRLDDYEIFTIRDNVRLGTWYLSKLIKYFKGDQNAAIKAYNVGMGFVEKNYALPYETVDYHQFVSQWQQEYKLADR
jgi:soluble lytic murein transglycosylase-like protein